MRAFLYLTCCVAVIGVAYWAYKENYQTQASIRRVSTLQRQIASERAVIGVLKVEWAYLNRPNRLRQLVQMNYDDLQLLPLLPEHFADVELVGYPQLKLHLNQIKNPITVQSVDEEAYP